MSMNVESLESYGTERYYLLSEIEQKSTYVFVDEPAFGEETIKRPLALNYLLHDLTKNIAHDSVSDSHNDNNNDDTVAFQSRIQQAFARTLEYTKDPDLSHFVAFIELLIPKETKWEEVSKDRVSAMLVAAQESISKLKNNTQVTIIFGVTDDTTGTPALSKINNFLDELGRRGLGTSDVNVIGNRSDFMGFDHSLEPDTNSNIFQVLCYEQKNGVEDICADLIGTLRARHAHLAHMSTHMSTSSSSSKLSSTEGYEGTSWNMTWIHLLLVLGGALAYCIYKA